MKTASAKFKAIAVYIQQSVRFCWSVIRRLSRRFPYIALLIVVILVIATGYFIWRDYQYKLWRNATDAYRHADYKKSYSLIKSQTLPSDRENLRVYSQTMLATQHLDPALKGYQSLYEKSKDPQVKIIIGNIYNEKHDYDKAVSIYEEIISSNPNFVQAYVNLATVRRLQGNTAEAIRTAKRGVKNNPGSVVLCELVVSMTMDDKQSEDYKSAITSLKKLNPNDPLLEMLKEAPVK